MNAQIREPTPPIPDDAQAKLAAARAALKQATTRLADKAAARKRARDVANGAQEDSLRLMEIATAARQAHADAAIANTTRKPAAELPEAEQAHRAAVAVTNSKAFAESSKEALARVEAEHAALVAAVAACEADVRTAARLALVVESDAMADEALNHELAALAIRERLAGLHSATAAHTYADQQTGVLSALSAKARTLIEGPPPLGHERHLYLADMMSNNGPHKARVVNAAAEWSKRFEALIAGDL